MNKSAAILIAIMVLPLLSCTPTRAVRGNLLQPYQIATVQVGHDTQPDVARILGSPTVVAPFDDHIWYYMGQETEKKGPLDPKIVKEKTYRVTFNDQNVVTSIDDVTHTREDVPYDHDKTATNGNEITITQELLGNLGKFNKSADQHGGVTGGDQGTGNGR